MRMNFDDDDDDDDETDGAIDMKVHESLASTSRRTFQCAQFSQTAQDLHTPDWNAMSPVSKLFFSQRIWFLETSTLIFCMLSLADEEIDSKRRYMIMGLCVSPLCYIHTCGVGVLFLKSSANVERYRFYWVAVPPESKVLESRSATWEYSPSLFLSTGWKPNSEIFVANCFGNGGNKNSASLVLCFFVEPGIPSSGTWIYQRTASRTPLGG